MKVEIEYKISVYKKDLKNIDRKDALRVIDKLEVELKKNPDKGIPLKGKFKGLFKLRVGGYRVIYAKTPKGVLVTRIKPRGQAYK